MPAAFPCIPNCHCIMSHPITGDYVIKFERNSFEVQLSARVYQLALLRRSRRRRLLTTVNDYGGIQ
ncbi:MAG: hypothetical protein FRX49_03592 [Trebouxia sp. A1-2]|nr:MAG: hypothetical protein FRX49_03592 [Trebouxia sp. A1-2]